MLHHTQIADIKIEYNSVSKLCMKIIQNCTKLFFAQINNYFPTAGNNGKIRDENLREIESASIVYTCMTRLQLRQVSIIMEDVGKNF